ncbi:hypothetical protein SK128_006018 [Halocaridina rubra]|uniref:Uncharacterized protein n=1 Tax=Halocaridina rubra TaxID=373956 RepID=A0AAN8X488_HALRR
MDRSSPLRTHTEQEDRSPHWTSPREHTYSRSLSHLFLRSKDCNIHREGLILPNAPVSVIDLKLNL